MCVFRCCCCLVCRCVTTVQFRNVSRQQVQNRLHCIIQLSEILIMAKNLPEFVLFGASMVEWSFDERTQGFGWFLENMYKDKVVVLNEGTALFWQAHIYQENL